MSSPLHLILTTAAHTAVQRSWTRITLSAQTRLQAKRALKKSKSQCCHEAHSQDTSVAQHRGSAVTFQSTASVQSVKFT